MKTTETASAKFDKATRSVERMIAKYAKNEVESEAVCRSLRRLEDMTSTPELRSDGLNEARFERISALFAAKRTANEAAYHVRVAGRNAELARLRQETRDEQSTPYANFRNGRPVRIDG